MIPSQIVNRNHNQKSFSHSSKNQHGIMFPVLSVLTCDDESTAGAPGPFHMPTIATSSLTKILHCHPC
jgi:hypothetical protein